MAPPRRAFVCCYDPRSGETWDGVANLAEGRLEGWRHVAGAQARIVSDEFAMGGEVAKADPRVIAALARRGITDLTGVLIEAWSAGNFGIAEEQGERIAYCHCFLRNTAGDNPYERPIANLHPVVDLRRRIVIRVDDFGVVPLPPDGKPLRQESLAHGSQAACRSPSRKGRASPSKEIWCAGRSGRCASASMSAMA